VGNKVSNGKAVFYKAGA